MCCWEDSERKRELEREREQSVMAINIKWFLLHVVIVQSLFLNSVLRRQEQLSVMLKHSTPFPVALHHSPPYPKKNTSMRVKFHNVLQPRQTLDGQQHVHDSHSDNKSFKCM